ncbi:hypothetical protein H5410_054350 [Solanum commersonii]|uniref:Alcohol dehydrogenase-like N-terminal domain-containing protein n=1 Tax=Solanum commersonii TaxID=4109 RepID=A0A9J5WGY1_SOLCO|nr:hypothetical protein H5410_054350 [Solanum commersonii]
MGLLKIQVDEAAKKDYTLENIFVESNYCELIYSVSCTHEVVGVVIEVGSKVEKFKVGDKVGVGCMVGSCRKCENCSVDLENYCPHQIPTYNGYSLDGTPHALEYVGKNFVDGRVASFMCRITTYSPLEYFGLEKPGMHIGLGGQGHMAVKFAKAFRTKVTVISTSANKKQKSIERLGAESFLISRDPEQMKVNIITRYH